MNFGKELIDRVVSIVVEISVNGCIFIGETFFGMGWEAEQKKKEKNKRKSLSYMPMEELGLFSNKDGRRGKNDLLVM